MIREYFSFTILSLSPFYYSSPIIRTSCAIDRGSIRCWRAFSNFPRKKTIDYYSKEAKKRIENCNCAVLSIVAIIIGNFFEIGGENCSMMVRGIAKHGANLMHIAGSRDFMNFKLISCIFDQNSRSPTFDRRFFFFFFRQFVPFP